MHVTTTVTLLSTPRSLNPSLGLEIHSYSLVEKPTNPISGKAYSTTKGGLLHIYATLTRITSYRVSNLHITSNRTPSTLNQSAMHVTTTVILVWHQKQNYTHDISIIVYSFYWLLLTVLVNTEKRFTVFELFTL